MLFIALRAADVIFAGVVAILVSAAIRRTSIAKLITIVFTAAVVAFFEWLMIWARPRPPVQLT
jgi:hypothetical protein